MLVRWLSMSMLLLALSSAGPDARGYTDQFGTGGEGKGAGPQLAQYNPPSDDQYYERQRLQEEKAKLEQERAKLEAEKARIAQEKARMGATKKAASKREMAQKAKMQGAIYKRDRQRRAMSAVKSAAERAAGELSSLLGERKTRHKKRKRSSD
ncbi:MAG: hypothetical protein C5B46_01890 [Proteobacteria bacterium]|nr:MAG: hypothetical protein C5B46_01890 [Pseudomonadota bacterium]